MVINIHDEVLAFIAENQDLNETGDNNESKKISNSLFMKNNTKNTIALEAMQTILNYSKKFSFKIVDNRIKNGALWICHDSDKSIHAASLTKLGMKYKLGRGWWIK